MEAARASRGGDRRRAILDAALRVFTDKGFHSATVEDVRRLSGASVGSIYHHFGGKEQLAAALYVEGLGDYQAGLLRLLARHEAPEDGVKALVRHHLRWVRGNPELAQFLLNPREVEVRLASEGPVRELNRAVAARTEEWRRPHVERGHMRPMPLGLFYSILIGPSQVAAREWLQGRRDNSIAETERVLAEAAWNALSAKGDS